MAVWESPEEVIENESGLALRLADMGLVGEGYSSLYGLLTEVRLRAMFSRLDYDVSVLIQLCSLCRHLQTAKNVQR